MIGLDTNVLVRLLTGDDEGQAKRARSFLAKNCSTDDPAFVSSVVLAETFWVLRSVYGLPREEIAEAISLLFSVGEIRLEDEASAHRAWQVYSGDGADFADVLISAIDRERGCSTTITFDRKAGKLEGFRLLS